MGDSPTKPNLPFPFDNYIGEDVQMHFFLNTFLEHNISAVFPLFFFAYSFSEGKAFSMLTGYKIGKNPILYPDVENMKKINYKKKIGIKESCEECTPTSLKKCRGNWKRKKSCNTKHSREQCTFGMTGCTGGVDTPTMQSYIPFRGLHLI